MNGTYAVRELKDTESRLGGSPYRRRDEDVDGRANIIDRRDFLQRAPDWVQDCCLLPADFFELATTTKLRGHPLKLRVTGAKLDIRKFFFSNRVIEAWNALPADVVMSSSVEAFKRKLDQCTTKRHNVT
ncbi:hypothetical protein SprV_0200682400 [Sparganum proliferum]